MGAVGDFVDKHPKADAALGITAAVAIVGYNILRIPDRALRGVWFWTTTPLEGFEPKHDDWEAVEAPYWQDLVFADGRLEKLLTRLEDQPQMKDRVQKITLLNSIGGLRVLPGHRDLVKYGMNDNQILNAMHAVDMAVFQQTRHHGLQEEKTGRLLMTRDGIYTADELKTPIIQKNEDTLYFNLGLTDLIDACRASGCKDELAVSIASTTSRAVYDWLLDDVLPAVPNAFFASYSGGYKATPQTDGSFILDRLPETYHLKDPDYGRGDFLRQQSRNNVKSLYEIMVDGYKGTLPLYPQPEKPSQSGPAPMV